MYRCIATHNILGLKLLRAVPFVPDTFSSPQNVLQLFGKVKQLDVPIAGRKIDFLVQIGNKSALVEAKYSLPRAGNGLTRLVAQSRAMISNTEGHKVVVWSLRPASKTALNKLESQLGHEAFNKIQFVEGIEGLASWMQRLAAL